MQVQRDENRGEYVFGVELEGVFVPFASRKLGGIDSDIESARLVAQQRQQQPPTEQAAGQPPAEQPPGEQPPPQ